jgi:hypothetical protein
MEALESGNSDQSTVVGRTLLFASAIFHMLQKADFGQVYDVAFKVLTLASLTMACLVYYKKLRKK